MHLSFPNGEWLSLSDHPQYVNLNLLFQILSADLNVDSIILPILQMRKLKAQKKLRNLPKSH